MLVDPLTGQEGDEGEICVDLSAPHTFLMTGYLGNPERNAEAMAGGYYHTGDTASRDGDGFITYIGRTDTHGGAADSKPCTAGEARVPYTANYSFYTGK